MYASISNSTGSIAYKLLHPFTAAGKDVVHNWIAHLSWKRIRNCGNGAATSVVMRAYAMSLV